MNISTPMIIRSHFYITEGGNVPWHLARCTNRLNTSALTIYRDIKHLCPLKLAARMGAHTTVCSSKCKKMTKAVTMAGWWTLFLPLFSTYSLSLPSGWACEAYPLLLWHWVAPQTGRGTDRTQLCCTTQSTAHRPVSITMMGGRGWWSI